VAGICGHVERLSGCVNAGNFLTSCKFTVSFSRRTLLHGVSKYTLAPTYGRTSVAIKLLATVVKML
jgi:hypothetical protein